MKAHLVPIGNSKGVRIPKSILESCGFKEEVEMIIRKDALILRPIPQVRENWDKSFQKMAEENDDLLVFEDTHDWDENEWEWS